MPLKKTSTNPILSSVEKQSSDKKLPHPLQDAFHFISRFIAKPHAVGSIWPSSRHLGKAMLHDITLKAGDVVVEYGPGTGPFTSLLRHTMPPGVEYLGIERDRKLYTALKRRFPEMRFHHGSAEDTHDLLNHYKLPQASLIVSGLPFANMPASLQARILNASKKALRSDGFFRTFTYLMASMSPRKTHFQKMLAECFYHNHGTTKVMLNFPPARVLSFSHPVKNSMDTGD